ncbi:MAG: hypothetical protein AABY22_11985 [Nanoarchaeota archaeon]
MNIWLIFLIWILYCIIDGIRDSLFYHHYNLKTERLFNEHIVFVIQRGIVALILLLLSLNIWLIIPFILSFSFFHNGSYYTTRYYLWKRTYYNGGEYNKKWFAQSITSTSFWTKYMTPVNRTILFILSIGILFFI